MKKVAKTIILLLTLCVCASLCAGTAQAKVKKGKWQGNISWSYNTKTKELVISGNGKIAEAIPTDDGSIEAGWYKYSHKAKKLRITGNITHIRSFLAAGLEFRNVKSIEFTNSIRTIEDNAFWELLSLKSLKLPPNLKVIGADAFMGSTFQKLYIPASVEKMGAGAFAGNEQLKKVILEEGLEIIGPSAFWSCTKLTKIELPKSLKSLKPGCFLITGLKKITIPENVEEIGARAFVQFSLEKATLKKVVIKSKKIKKWGKDIFDEAHKELVIEVPKSKKKEYEKALRSKGLPDYVKVIGKKSLD